MFFFPYGLSGFVFKRTVEDIHATRTPPSPMLTNMMRLSREGALHFGSRSGLAAMKGKAVGSCHEMTWLAKLLLSSTTGTTGCGNTNDAHATHGISIPRWFLLVRSTAKLSEFVCTGCVQRYTASAMNIGNKFIPLSAVASKRQPVNHAVLHRPHISAMRSANHPLVDEYPTPKPKTAGQKHSRGEKIY